MKKFAKKAMLATTLTLASTFGLAACQMDGNHSASASMKQPQATKNIVDVAQSNPDFSILVEAVVAADLVDTLANPDGNFTVFAPTNDAFASLLGELGATKAQLLSNKPLLANVLAYHVLGQKVMAADVKPGKATSVQGGSFVITPDLKILDANGRSASIVATDVAASNGVIHVLDKVILPAMN